MLSGLGLGTWLHFISLDFCHNVSLWVNHVKERSPPWTPRRGKDFKMLVLSTLSHALNVLSVTWELDAETTGRKTVQRFPQAICLSQGLPVIQPQPEGINDHIERTCCWLPGHVSDLGVLCLNGCILYKGQTGSLTMPWKIGKLYNFIKDNYLRFEVKTKTELILNLKVKNKIGLTQRTYGGPHWELHAAKKKKSANPSRVSVFSHHHETDFSSKYVILTAKISGCDCSTQISHQEPRNILLWPTWLPDSLHLLSLSTIGLHREKCVRMCAHACMCVFACVCACVRVCVYAHAYIHSVLLFGGQVI